MSIMLIFICLGIAVVILMSKINLNHSLLDTMKDNINKDCAYKSGPLWEIDLIYKQGANVLCTTACPCAADKTMWSKNEQQGIVTSGMG
jgi:hypothetical protein